MPNNRIQSLTVNGVTYDIVDNTSGYITAQYIENKIDYSIPVSRVGEIVVGETAIGTDSTNLPTSKAVVDYVDERVVQEMDAIDVGVISINGKTGSVTLNASDIGAATTSQIPTSTSQLTNDSGFITSDSDEKLAVSRNLDNGGVYDVVLGSSSDPINTETKFQSKTFQYSLFNNTASLSIGNNSARGELRLYGPQSSYSARIRSTAIASNYTIYLPNKEGTVALTSDIPSVPSWALQSTKPTYTASEVGALPSSTIIPSKTSDLTNDSGYLTASDIASVMTYKGTKANYAALPSTGNTTGDVWHLTDTGAEWAWDGSAWQELGTAIDLSNYATKATTLAGYGITDAKIENGTITLGSNTITPLTSYTETDPTVPSWAKASSKPSYGLTEISGTDDLRAIEALTGTSGLLKKTAANTWTLDTNTYLTSYTETDPTVPSWAKQSSKPTYTAAEVGALPDSTVIPSKTSDLTNDSGFITTDSDENVKQTSLNGTNTTRYLIGGLGGSQTSGVSVASKIYMNDASPDLTIGLSSETQRLSLLDIGINFTYSEGNKQGRLRSATITTDRDWTLPDKTGTIALTSDIPSVYSSTNTGGYLTMATLPIYDGTVV